MTIFVSHSSADGDRVRALVQSLDATGDRVWLDQDLSGGEAWWTAILRQIRECSVFVFALSADSLQSEACSLELSYARDLGLPILPVQIGDVHGMRDHLIFTYQAIDYRNPTASSGIALARAVLERGRDRQPLPDPLPAPPPMPFEYLLQLGTSVQGRAPLSPDDQDAIVRQLRQALRDERDASARRTVTDLLTTLRARPEVTHRTVTEINDLLGEQRPARPAQPGQTPRQAPAPGWYPDPAGGPQQRYWDGQRWLSQAAPVNFVTQAQPVTQSQPVMQAQPVPLSSAPAGRKAMSIVAFVLGAIALLIPYVGLVGIGFGVAAAVRKEKLGGPSLAVAAIATALGFVVWSAVYS